MIYRILIILISSLLLIFNCTKPPEVIPDIVVDLSYDELKLNYGKCMGEGVMTAQGILPWKLNYTFTTQNDSSFLQFKDIFGRRLLFVQALPDEITLWDMQKNVQYYADESGSIPMFNTLESYDIAQILWGEIPMRFGTAEEESGFQRDSKLVNFESSLTQYGKVLDKVLFNLESHDTVVEFIISERDFGKANSNLLKGIPPGIPFN